MKIDLLLNDPSLPPVRKEGPPDMITIFHNDDSSSSTSTHSASSRRSSLNCTSTAPSSSCPSPAFGPVRTQPMRTRDYYFPTMPTTTRRPRAPPTASERHHRNASEKHRRTEQTELLGELQRFLDTEVPHWDRDTQPLTTSNTNPNLESSKQMKVPKRAVLHSTKVLLHQRAGLNRIHFEIFHRVLDPELVERLMRCEDTLLTDDFAACFQDVLDALAGRRLR
ncbi:hypothetical protein M011DRAFT_478795 [Sporormia fimetaria CBS 119925]|uniref:Uncharacterized protein n=1 Tax=Sporormia fimetaria CBS 119925 TaxID=1340428 RepID=A0A6A6V4Z9_9PLEO|nr:hypothetical protein M011DRAFT_478795 [Sporormia fimetaria CBS 119925]